METFLKRQKLDQIRIHISYLIFVSRFQLWIVSRILLSYQKT